MARFVITDPSEQTQIFEISSPTVSVGRAETNDLVLRHPSVSRHHVRISVLPGNTTLLNDLGSLNGTFMVDDIRQVWNANKLIPYGLWSSSLSPRIKLYLAKMEGEFSGWKGKVFDADVTRSWQALNDIEWDGTTLKFSFPGVSFCGVIDRESMKGRIKYQKLRTGSNESRNEEVETEWEAKKAPDDIPF